MQWIQRFFRVAMNVGEPLPGKCFTVWFAACMRVLISLKCVGGDRIPQSFMLISLFANNRHVCFCVSNLLPINLKDIAVPLYSSSANYLRRYPSFSSNLFISTPYSHRPLPIRSQKLCQSRYLHHALWADMTLHRFSSPSQGRTLLSIIDDFVSLIGG